jgi:hypothetical protein
MIENLSTNLIHGFAEECAGEFHEATDEELPLSLAKKAKRFIDLAKEKIDVDVSHHFTNFITTTTSQPISWTTENSKLTTLKTSGNQNDTYNIGYVCEFRRNKFSLNCLELALIIVTILILNVIIFVFVYQSALKSNPHRSGQGQIVEMTPLYNNR